MCLATSHAACDTERPDAVYGVLLGMTPDMVRQRFVHECGGAFTVHATNVPGEVVLDWSVSYVDAPPRNRCVPPIASVPLARFEFHRGMLVAIRIATSVHGVTRQQVNGAFVMEGGRSRGMPGLHYKTVIALSCPFHAEEVRTLQSRQHSGPLYVSKRIGVLPAKQQHQTKSHSGPHCRGLVLRGA